MKHGLDSEAGWGKGGWKGGGLKMKAYKIKQDHDRPNVLSIGISIELERLYIRTKRENHKCSNGSIWY